MSSRSCNVEGATHSNFADLDVGRGASESGEGGDGGHICAGFGDSNLSLELVGEDRERDARAVEDSVPYLYCFFFLRPKKKSRFYSHGGRVEPTLCRLRVHASAGRHHMH